MWWNLKRSGAGDYRTEHAGCPVLSGVKWGKYAGRKFGNLDVSRLLLRFRLATNHFGITVYFTTYKCMVQWLRVLARPLSAVHNDFCLRLEVAPVA